MTRRRYLGLTFRQFGSSPVNVTQLLNQLENIQMDSGLQHTQLYSPSEKAAQLYAKNESEHLTNQQHETLKTLLSAVNTMTTYYVLRSRKFLQKFTFSIVNRNRRQ